MLCSDQGCVRQNLLFNPNSCTQMGASPLTFWLKGEGGCVGCVTAMLLPDCALPLPCSSPPSSRCWKVPSMAWTF